MVLHNLNFDPFHSRTVGFEKIFDRLSRIAESDIPSQSSYPPYNIHRQGDDKFDIEIAVAGFSEEDLDIEYKDNELTIEGKKKEDEQSDYVHKGIANRSFKKVWHIEDHTEVIDAKLKHGLLKVSLEKIVPEELKPKKIKINSKQERRTSEQLLQEGKA
jgi:molecular chaperone IbpA|tara:strand:- start:278 stop:754 length:477 start_codon:yes stop_codon:yes gene_type:complete